MSTFLTTGFWGSQDAVTICTLGIGTAFGESILDNTPRHATIVTRESSELLRIEQKDFKALWEVSLRAALSINVVAEKKGSTTWIMAFSQVLMCSVLSQWMEFNFQNLFLK